MWDLWWTLWYCGRVCILSACIRYLPVSIIPQMPVHIYVIIYVTSASCNLNICQLILTLKRCFQIRNTLKKFHEYAVHQNCHHGTNWRSVQCTDPGVLSFNCKTFTYFMIFIFAMSGPLFFSERFFFEVTQDCTVLYNTMLFIDSYILWPCSFVGQHSHTAGKRNPDFHQWKNFKKFFHSWKNLKKKIELWSTHPVSWWWLSVYVAILWKFFGYPYRL